MADFKATQRRQAPGLVSGKGEGANIKNLTATIEQAASASATTITFGYVPSNARILGSSRVYFDDLATTGAPTLDIGFFAVDSNITSDDDALNDGLTLATATPTGGALVKDHANYGKKAWEFVSGQATDPGGVLMVRGTVRDAATTATGTVTLDLNYMID
jgi:hypothetical protein